MQEQFGQMKDKLEDTMVEGSAGNGLVKVTLNGAKALKKIVIQPDCVNRDDIEGLQDLILGAFDDAAKKIESQNPTLPKMPWG